MLSNLEKYKESKSNDNDCVDTPRWVVEEIYKLIGVKNYKSIWLPFDNYDSEFKLVADDLNVNYWNTHIFDEEGHDFFSTIPSGGAELMISNPPFSLQNEILERSFYLIENGYVKSFALLLPISTLETKKRANIYQKHKNNLSVVIFKNRIKFKGHKTSFNKGCCWICYNIETLKDKKISWI